MTVTAGGLGWGWEWEDWRTRVAMRMEGRNADRGGRWIRKSGISA